MKLIFVARLTCWICLLRHLNNEVQSTEWIKFASNDHYMNLRVVFETENFLSRLYIAKDESLISSRMQCSQYCVMDQSCYALNFYQTGTSYVCELLQDNLCLNKTNKVFINWPGGQVWDKLSTGTQESCLETQYPSLSNVHCQVLRPGCFGYWPNCSNCYQSCKGWYNASKIDGVNQCTLWPRDHTGRPIFVKCFGQKTLLIQRIVDITTGNLSADYQMSFYDINRIYETRDHKYLEFHFITRRWVDHYCFYKNSYMDVNGTLYNLTYSNAYLQFNINFNQNSQAGIPFVNVTDDRYGCGSFWLLDPSNATYCPGGNASMFGKILKNASQVISTGMKHPTLPIGEIFDHTGSFVKFSQFNTIKFCKTLKE